jgi:hypothetical protein
MDLKTAHTVSKTLKRSPKYNRKIKVGKIIVRRNRGCVIEVWNKETGRPFLITDQHIAEGEADDTDSGT